MTVTTEEYWEIDGVNLNNLAFNIETLSGRSGLPPKRGDNETIPGSQGERWLPKSFGPTQLTLSMWVRGADDDGVVPADRVDRVAMFNENLRTLKKVFGVRHRLVTLTKRVRLTSGIVTLTANAEVRGTMEPNFSDRFLARFSVDILLPDPFWYGEEITAVLGGAGTIDNVGDALADNMRIRFTGPLPVNTQLLNQSFTTHSVLVGIAESIPSGAWIELDTRDFLATDNLGANKLPAVFHEGGIPWMQILPGVNNLIVTGDGGIGAGTVTIYLAPPYL